MLTQTQRDEHIEKIERVPIQLEDAISGLMENQFDTPYGEGKWTIRQVCHHLADSHAVGYARCRLILTEEHPTLITYNQELWSELPDSTGMPVDVSLSFLHGLHARWVYLLKTLTETEWARTCHHPERGDLTMEDMLDIYSDHGESHIQSILNLREAKGW